MPDPRRIACALALIPPLAAQQTTVVSGGGSALQQAIRLATPGDILLVRPGAYSEIIAGKPLRIVCDAGVTIGGGASPSLTVQSLPWGTLALRGATIAPSGAAPGAPGIVLRQCVGAVAFEDVTFRLHPWTPALLDQAYDVSFNGCTDVPLLAAQLSTVALSRSNVAQVSNPWPVQAALELIDSRLTLADSVVDGPTCTAPACAQPAIGVTRGSVTLAGTTVVRGGTVSASVAAPAILGSSAVVRVGPAVQVSAQVAPAIAGTVSVRREPIASIAASGDVASGRFTSVLTAQPGTTTATFLSWRVLPYPFPNHSGELWVDPNCPVLDIGVVPASGTRTTTINVFVQHGTPVVLQPISLTGSGYVLGAPTRIVAN